MTDMALLNDCPPHYRAEIYRLREQLAVKEAALKHNDAAYVECVRQRKEFRDALIERNQEMQRLREALALTCQWLNHSRSELEPMSTPAFTPEFMLKQISPKEASDGR